MRVLVTGATGFVGRHLVLALLEADHDVTALVRDASAYDPPADVRVVEGDLLEPESCRTAFDVDAAYYLVHSMQAGEDFEERDRRLARNFSRLASGTGVDRVIYLGGLGADDAELSKHLRSRREVERLLADGEYDLTTLRAAIIVGKGSAGFEIVRQLTLKLPVMITPAWVRTDCQPIAIDDAIAYLVGVLEEPETAGETYDIGGPEVLSYQSMMRRVGRMLDSEPLIVPVPVLSPRLSARWVELMTDVPNSVARPLIEGLQTPVVATDDRIRDHVEVDLTPFDEAVRSALGEQVESDPPEDVESGTLEEG